MSNEKFLKEDEQLDNLFRSSLGEMQTDPSAGVWKKLNRQMTMSELGRFQFINLPKAFWGIIPLAAILTGVILYLGTGESESLPNQHDETITSQEVILSPTTKPDPLTLESTIPEPASNGISTAQEAQVKLSTSTGQIATSEEAAITPAKQVTTSEEAATTPAKQVTTSVITTAPRHHGTNSTTAPLHHGTTSTTAPLHHGTTSNPQIVSPDPISGLNGQYPEPLLSVVVNPPTMQSVINPVPKETSPESLRKPLSRSLDLGINITPDMVFYNNASGSFKYNYTFDFGARYNLGRFYIQSGAGLTYSTDIGDYAISYLKNDSIGYYYTINSYSIEPGNTGDPQFEAKQVTVYDSVQYLYDYSTKNKYYYLQIPLSVGYRIIDNAAWRLSVEAGLLYAYLVSINEPAPTFYIPEGRILDIERRGAERNKHSLGLTAGISVEYQFARNFFLLIEPTFKYYLQAIDENSSRGDKQPYSIGLRTGIWYRLNFQNKTR